MKCPHCGGELPMAQCPECGGETPADGDYCCRCGAILDLLETSPDLSNRVLCPDGNCIGVLDKHGVCSVCGRAYENLESEPENG
ncbi:MAG: hypothetical protein JRI57_07270 [Deltaproteobacteria bacterium]|nr:hypothetical protein [Deltaproteobacteria bacterium]MBW1952617.1 hypothetical protein [Deltaproteobacteria bacterium]MBW1986256.1 hypothetical protein [Deltaproteobacteria bacterium]MBW2134153.1 hypothetical protein [Deltaproteobacteria bacterium]